MMFSLEEALGLKPKTEPAVTAPVAEEAEFSDVDLKRVIRRKLVFERRVRGDTDEEILHFLAQNGHPICKRTLHYDLKSDEVGSLTDELVRVQFKDIALLRAFALQDKEAPNLKALAAAIAARGFMISCLKPKSGPEVVMQQVTQVNAKTETKVTVDLGKMSKDDREAVLRAEEALTRAETETGPQ
jgi:hypothetical protein